MPQENNLFNRVLSVFGQISPDFKQFQNIISRINSAEAYEAYCSFINNINKNSIIPRPVVNFLLFAPLLFLPEKEIYKIAKKRAVQSPQTLLGTIDKIRKTIFNNIDQIENAINNNKPALEARTNSWRFSDLIPGVGNWLDKTIDSVSNSVRNMIGRDIFAQPQAVPGNIQQIPPDRESLIDRIKNIPGSMFRRAVPMPNIPSQPPAQKPKTSPSEQQKQFPKKGQHRDSTSKPTQKPSSAQQNLRDILPPHIQSIPFPEYKPPPRKPGEPEMEAPMLEYKPPPRKPGEPEMEAPILEYPPPREQLNQQELLMWGEKLKRSGKDKFPIPAPVPIFRFSDFIPRYAEPFFNRLTNAIASQIMRFVPPKPLQIPQQPNPQPLKSKLLPHEKESASNQKPFDFNNKTLKNFAPQSLPDLFEIQPQEQEVQQEKVRETFRDAASRVLKNLKSKHYLYNSITMDLERLGKLLIRDLSESFSERVRRIPYDLEYYGRLINKDLGDFIKYLRERGQQDLPVVPPDKGQFFPPLD